MFFALIVWSSKTNPYHPWGSTYQVLALTRATNGTYSATSIRPLTGYTNPIMQGWAHLKVRWHRFASTTLSHAPPIVGDYAAILKAITTERFDARKPYLTASELSPVLHPRDIGIYYHHIFFFITFVTQEDWHNRTVVYAQTVAYALESFKACGGLYTTIVPVSPRAVSCIQIPAYPTDSLYAVLYGIDTLRERAETKAIGDYLLKEYSPTLMSLHYQFTRTVVDAQTGLPQKNMHYAGAIADVTRDRSLYDAVMIAKTDELMQKFGLVRDSSLNRSILKRLILKTYWHKTSVFVEDMSVSSMQNGTYASDWLVMTLTDFLDPRVAGDKPYIEAMFQYIADRDLDYPMGLVVKAPRAPSATDDAGLFAQRSQDSLIDSFWGAQYIHVLAGLCRYSDLVQERACAEYKVQTAQYESLTELFGGFPSVYTYRAGTSEEPSSQSSLRTGWIIEFEHARRWFASLSQES